MSRRTTGGRHNLALAYREDARAAERVVTAATEAGARCMAVRADITRQQGVERLFAAGSELGVITGLVNNAGLTGYVGDLAETPVDIVRRVIDVNFLGVVLCARQAAQVMSTKRGGRGGAIVNASSAAATLGSAHEYRTMRQPKPPSTLSRSDWPKNSPGTGSESTRSLLESCVPTSTPPPGILTAPSVWLLGSQSAGSQTQPTSLPRSRGC